MSEHGTRVPNKTCAQCETRFYAQYEKKYCSEECRKIGFTATKSPDSNYGNAKKETSCELCGDSFEYYPSAKEGLYCSSCVENESWRDPPELEGSDHPRWNGGKVTVDCDVCGDSVERYPSDVDEVVCCSEDCRGRWLSEAFTGEGHPNWAGGGNEAYGQGWAAVREAALERDDHECVHCGAARDELGRNPDVHHIVPVRAFVASEEYEKTDAHFLENVVSLCLACHRKAEFGRISAATLLEAIGVSRSDEGQRAFGRPVLVGEIEMEMEMETEIASE